MNRKICLILAVCMLLTLAACGQNNTEPEIREWTRQGSFEDGNGNYLLVSLSETEGYEGWAITLMLAEESVGWIIQQEGNTLYGNLRGWDENEDPFNVTISEEGEDGLKLEVQDGETYHFKPMDLPKATVIVTIHTEGLGQIAYAEEGGEPEFEEDFPTQSAQLNLAEPTVYELDARPDEGWHFVKWTRNGEDFSNDARITVAFDESAEYTAVFEYTPDEEESIIGIKQDPEEAEHQIIVAMQYLLEEAYGTKINDARIYVEKIYTAEEEETDELLRSYELGPDEVAFEVHYELHPAADTDVNELMAATGEYDEESGWVKEKYNVGILRPNPDGDQPAYVITDFGTAF